MQTSLHMGREEKGGMKERERERGKEKGGMKEREREREERRKERERERGEYGQSTIKNAFSIGVLCT